MNKFTVFFDYRDAQGKTRAAKKKASDSNTNSVELGPWLDVFANKEKIHDMRLFYVLKPNSEDVVKFGIAGTKGGTGAWGRLHSYINDHGYSSDLNRCTGIQMLYLAGNKYSKTVEITNSDVYKKELMCKKYFRSPEVDAHILGRGFERINLDRIKELFDIIDDPSNKNFGDVETERRTSQRLQQQELTSEDKVLKITGHTTIGGKSRKMTRYLCYWNRPAVLTKEKLVRKSKNTRKDSDLRDLDIALEKEKRFDTEEIERTFDHETEEFAKNIILFPGGAKALEVYKILHPTATFRD